MRGRVKSRVVGCWAHGPGGCSYGICFAVSLYPGTAIPHTPKIRRSYTRKLYGNLTSGGQSPWQSPGAYVVRPRIPGEIRVTVDPRPAGPVARAGRRSRIATNIFQVANSSYCFTPRSNMQSSFLCKVRAPPEHRTVLWGWAVPFSLGATSTRSCTTCEPALLLCPPRASPSTEPRVASWRASCSSSLKACEGAVK